MNLLQVGKQLSDVAIHMDSRPLRYASNTLRIDFMSFFTGQRLSEYLVSQIWGCKGKAFFGIHKREATGIVQCPDRYSSYLSK